MIEVYDLKILLEEYGINSEKVLKKNSNIIDRGYYYEIKRVLNYLINELKISPSNIEKSPSIMYRNVNVVRNNYQFLKQTNLNNFDIETYLHILSTDPIELKKTYNYILSNYGVEFLNKITTILRVKVERIKEIENLMSNELDNLNKIVIFSASVSKLRINEIKKVINILRQNNVEIAGSVFFKSVKETEKIITVCKKNKIKITPTVFLKSANKLQETIKFLKNNYSDEFLKPLIINKDKKYLEKVFLYLESLGVLHVVINSSSILTLTLDEIIERKDFLESIGEDLVVKNKFNSIFGLSRNNYQKRKKYF